MEQIQLFNGRRVGRLGGSTFFQKVSQVAKATVLDDDTQVTCIDWKEEEFFTLNLLFQKLLLVMLFIGYTWRNVIY